MYNPFPILWRQPPPVHHSRDIIINDVTNCPELQFIAPDGTLTLVQTDAGMAVSVRLTPEAAVRLARTLLAGQAAPLVEVGVKVL